MKVIQEQAEFKPVTVKLESQFEVDVLSDILASCNNHMDDENINLEFIVQLSHSLADMSTSAYSFVYIDDNKSEGIIKFK